MGCEGLVGRMEAVFGGDDAGTGGGEGGMEEPDVGTGTLRGEIEVGFGGGRDAAEGGGEADEVGKSEFEYCLVLEMGRGGGLSLCGAFVWCFLG